MFEHRRHSGFSLTEVLLAVGTLTIGMVFIAGVFPVAIHFSTIATERTIAAVLADEAFAKIRLYAVGDPVQNTPGIDDIDLAELEEHELTGFYDANVFPAAVNIPPCEFAYPSDPNISILRKQYFWSALLRRVGPDPNRLVQVTVFVSRRTSPGLEYPAPPAGMGTDTVNWPMPVRVGVSQVTDNELQIDNANQRTFINDGYTIVDDRTGRIYRVLERYRDDELTVVLEDAQILLDRDWDDSPPGSDPEAVWVVPPPRVPHTETCSGRNPCIAIYQKVIRF